MATYYSQNLAPCEDRVLIGDTFESKLPKNKKLTIKTPKQISTQFKIVKVDLHRQSS